MIFNWKPMHRVKSHNSLHQLKVWGQSKRCPFQRTRPNKCSRNVEEAWISCFLTSYEWRHHLSLHEKLSGKKLHRCQIFAESTKQTEGWKISLPLCGGILCWVHVACTVCRRQLDTTSCSDEHLRSNESTCSMCLGHPTKNPITPSYSSKVRMPLVWGDCSMPHSRNILIVLPAVYWSVSLILDTRTKIDGRCIHWSDCCDFTHDYC